MARSHRPQTAGLRLLTLLLFAAAVGYPPAQAQEASHFHIVWVVVGEVASASGQPRAGRQLFNGPDIVAFSLEDVDVAQVTVQPEISQLTTGQRLCMTELRVSAFAPGGSPLESAPLSISIRQDHRHKLNLQRRSDDICFTPREPGEYPVRVTSLVPAPDGTMRGAQFFLRVAPNAG